MKRCVRALAAAWRPPRRGNLRAFSPLHRHHPPPPSRIEESRTQRHWRSLLRRAALGGPRGFMRARLCGDERSARWKSGPLAAPLRAPRRTVGRVCITVAPVRHHLTASLPHVPGSRSQIRSGSGSRIDPTQIDGAPGRQPRRRHERLTFPSANFPPRVR